MLREFLHSKIHRATITDSNLNYVGSITIDEEFLEKAFRYCVDSTIVGNYLTTTGFSPMDDAKMIKEIGRKLI